MSVETPTGSSERTYEKTLLAGATRLGAWGPGLLTKAEGLWQTPHGLYVLGERVEGDEKASFRVVDESEATHVLRAHGQAWRAGQIEKAREAAESAADGEATEAAGGDAPAADGEAPASEA